MNASPQTRPIDLLHRAAVASAPDPEVWQWIQGACQAALHGEPLLASLGLDGRALTEARLTARNRILQDAFALIEGPNRTARIDEFAKIIHRFESHRWPQWRALNDAPKTATNVQTLLFRARRIHSLPGRRQLHNLLAG